MISSRSTKLLLPVLTWALPLTGAWAQAAVDTGAAAPSPEATLSLWDVVWKATVGSAIVMLPLFLLSVITVMLLVYYFFALTRGRVASDRFLRTAEALIQKGDFLGLLAVANRNNEATAQVIGRSVDFLTKNPEVDFENVREVAQAEGTRQAGALSQQVSYLSDIGAIAPMLGLLGTVIGMIESFHVLASDMAASKPMALAAGVAQALIATAAGLMIAIPALAGYVYYRGRVQGLISELESSSTYILSLLAVSYKKKVVSRPVETSDVF
jgi:biopolymer transport protein ExbB